MFSVQELNETSDTKNVYNVTPDLSKAAFLIISQVGDFCVQVSVTLTSTDMREEPTKEQATGE